MPNKSRTQLRSSSVIDQSSFSDSENSEDLVTAEINRYMLDLYQQADQIALAHLREVKNKTAPKVNLLPMNKAAPPLVITPKRESRLKSKLQVRDIFAELLNYTIQNYIQSTFESLVDLMVTRNLNLRYEGLTMYKCDRTELDKIIEGGYAQLKEDQICHHFQNDVDNSRAVFLQKIKSKYISQLASDFQRVNFSSLESRAAAQFGVSNRASTQPFAGKENKQLQNSNSSGPESKLLKQCSNSLGVHSSGNSFALTQIDLSSKGLRHLRCLREASDQYRSVICKNNK